jgi:hypothetical protein
MILSEMGHCLHGLFTSLVKLGSPSWLMSPNGGFLT